MTLLAIVAHPDRRAHVDKLATWTSADVVMWDDEERGCTDNHRMAWNYLADAGVPEDQFAVVIEDDAIPVPAFRFQLFKMLSVAPADVVSLYLGTGTPPQWQDILRSSVDPIGTDPNFLIAPDLLSCVGYAVRGEHIDSVIQALRYALVPADEAITGYLRSADLSVAYCRPSLLNHNNGAPIIQERADGLERSVPRRAWKFGSRSEWKNISAVLDVPKWVRTDPDGTKWYETKTRGPAVT